MAKKRENGQGSICKRKDGRWVGKMQIGVTELGKTQMKSVYGKTQAEAKRKLKEFKEELIRNDLKQVKKTTVKHYMEHWFNTTKAHQIKPSSYDKIEFVLNNQIYPYIGLIQMANINSNDVQRMVNELSDKYSYSTVNQAYHIVNDCFKTAVVKREIIYNPALGVTLPKRTEFKKDYVKFFTEDEVKKIIEESTRINSNGTHAHRLGWAVVLLLFTGMRIGELLGLKWENVDIDKKELRIDNTISRIKNRKENNTGKKYIQINQDTKTKAGTRTIPLINDSIKALVELKKVACNEDFVLTSKAGNIILPSSFRNMLVSILKRCGLKERGAHTLRHTFASMLFAKGVDVKVVSEILGHSNVTITYNTYIHLIKNQKQNAMHLIDNFGIPKNFG